MADPQKLDSWKEISAYLGRDERTVQRWAKERGLPVHRVPGGKRGGVFAYAAEVDAWLNGQPLNGLENGAAPSQPEPSALPRREIEHHPDPASAVLPIPPQPPPSLRLPSSRAILFSLFSLAGVLVLAASTYFILVAAASKRTPVRMGYNGQNLTAYDEAGQPLWSYALPGTFVPLDSRGSPETSQTRILDFDGDGEIEVFSMASWFSSGSTNSHLDSAVFRFSPRGELLQRYAPTEVVAFAGKSFRAPWTIRAVLFDDSNPEPSVWLAFSHHTWWPALLIRLDRHGREALRFTHSGWIQSLAMLSTASERFILAGGINNQAGAAMLAVLQESAPASAGPPDASGPYLCDHCPGQLPHRYYLFPRSEIARAAGLPYNQVVRIGTTDGGFHVYTEETPERNNLIYEFTADFQFVGVSSSDYYTALHDRLFQEGKLDHPALDCPEARNPPLPLQWRDGAWRKLQPRHR